MCSLGPEVCRFYFINSGGSCCSIESCESLIQSYYLIPARAVCTDVCRVFLFCNLGANCTGNLSNVIRHEVLLEGVLLLLGANVRV